MPGPDRSRQTVSRDAAKAYRRASRAEPQAEPSEPSEQVRTPKRRALLVLGMHRSGTSAIARTLSLLGAELPSRLVEPRFDNVKGFWESGDLIALHDRVLESAGTSWEDFAPFPASWHASDAAEGFRQEILAVLRRDFATSPLFVIKDPRICRLVPLWTSVLERFCTEPAFLISFRNPIEVVESLKARDGFHPAKSLLMWLRHVVDAERDSRGARRAFISYEALLQDWRGAVQRVGRELALEWPRLSHEADAAVEAFLDRKLRHEQSTLDEVRRRPEILDWARVVYEALLSAEAGTSSDLGDIVDRIGAQLDLADRAFGPVIADLNARLGQAYSSASQARAALTAAHAEIETRESDRERLRGEVADAQARASQAGRELAAQDERRQADQGRIRDLEREVSAERQLTLQHVAALARERADARETARTLAHAGSAPARLQERAEWVVSERDTLAARVSVLDGDLASVRGQAARLETDLATMRSSTSWRVTAPLRRALVRSPRALRLVRSALRFAGWTVSLRLPQEARAWWRARREAPRVAKSTLFDASWYMQQNPDVAVRDVDPCWHYLRYGGREGRDPHPLFDSSWYLDQNPDVAAAAVNPLAHFLCRGGAEGRDPHPLFDSSWYVEGNPDVTTAGVNPLVHYLARGSIEGRDPHPLFDTKAYLRANPDVAAAGVNPLVHYVLHGQHEGRGGGEGVATGIVEPPPTTVASTKSSVLDYARQEARRLAPSASLGRLTGYERRLLRKIEEVTGSTVAAARPGSHRHGILFVSHDASLSGAPLILLSLLRRFRQQANDSLFVLLLEGGDLEAEFARHAVTVNLAERVRQGGTLEEVLNVLAFRGISVGLCNTVATGGVAAELKGRGVPVISLVHELPTEAGLRGADRVLRALKNSDRAVVSSPSVERALRQSMGDAALPPVSVVPHGLVRENPFLGERTFARWQVAKQLDLPPDAFLVLGCGFACQRKGFDVFGTVLREVASRPEGRDCHFVWVGGRDEPFATWSRHDLVKAGVGHLFHHVEAARNPAIYFAAADLFAMTSREDPFPTVVLEAMEAGVPVLAFAGAGDAPLAMGSETGVVLPYLDAAAMARAILDLRGDPDRRRRLGAAAAARAREHYQFGPYFEAVSDLVQQLR
jgi:glycosyltransferase involved in cell wall biosynthesis